MPDATKRHLESAVGYGIGCAALGLFGAACLTVFALLALAMPMTVSIVTGTLGVLAFLGWRKRRRRQATESSSASMSSSDRPK